MNTKSTKEPQDGTSDNETGVAPEHIV